MVTIGFQRPKIETGTGQILCGRIYVVCQWVEEKKLIQFAHTFPSIFHFSFDLKKSFHSIYALD